MWCWKLELPAIWRNLCSFTEPYLLAGHSAPSENDRVKDIQLPLDHSNSLNLWLSVTNGEETWNTKVPPHYTSHFRLKVTESLLSERLVFGSCCGCACAPDLKTIHTRRNRSYESTNNWKRRGPHLENKEVLLEKKIVKPQDRVLKEWHWGQKCTLYENALH